MSERLIKLIPKKLQERFKKELFELNKAEQIEDIKEKLKNKEISKEFIEVCLRISLSEKFRIQKGIKEAVEKEENNLGQCRINHLDFEAPIWRGLEEIKEIQNDIDITVEVLKELPEEEDRRKWVKKKWIK